MAETGDHVMMANGNTTIASGGGRMYTTTEIGMERVEMIGSIHVVRGRGRLDGEMIIGDIRWRGKWAMTGMGSAQEHLK